MAAVKVVEPPDVWDFDLLFAQLKAELQNEAADNSSSSGGNVTGELYHAAEAAEL